MHPDGGMTGCIGVLLLRDDEHYDYSYDQQKYGRRKATLSDPEYPLLMRLSTGIGIDSRLGGRRAAQSLVDPVLGEGPLDRPNADPATSNHGESEAKTPHHAHTIARSIVRRKSTGARSSSTSACALPCGHRQIR